MIVVSQHKKNGQSMDQNSRSAIIGLLRKLLKTIAQDSRRQLRLQALSISKQQPLMPAGRYTP